MSLRMKQVRLSSTSATVAVEITVTGVTEADLSRRVPDGGKGAAVFNIELLGPTGDIVTDSYEISENQQVVQLCLLGYRFTPGDYDVRVTYIGRGEFDRVLHIP